MSISWSTIRNNMGLTGQFSISSFRALCPNNASSTVSASYSTSGTLYQGLISSNPATNALDIKTNAGVNTDGVYYINCNGTSTRTYCLMDNKYNGGGWMLIMKCTQSATFEYEASYWSNANVY